MAVASETCTQNAVKRKASIAGFPDGIRPAKRRAAKACQTCRSRKVRCDVVYCDGKPCTNCRLDEVECVVSDSRRKRKPRSDGGAERSPVSTAETDAGDPQSSSTHNDITYSKFSPTTYDDTVFFSASAKNSFELELDHHVPHMLYRTQGHRSSQEERARRMSMNSEHSSASSRMAASMASVMRSRSDQSSDFRVERKQQPLTVAMTPPPEDCESGIWSHTSLTLDERASIKRKAPSPSADLAESSAGRMMVHGTSDGTAACDNDFDEEFDLLFNFNTEMDLQATDNNADENSFDRGVEGTPLSAPNPSAVKPHSPSLKLYSGALIDMAISTPA